MWDVAWTGQRSQQTQAGNSCFPVHLQPCQAKLGFPHSEDIDAELIESLASSFQPTLLTHSCICVPPGYPDAHQISLAAILYPVSLPYLSLTFHTFNFNSHSNWKTRHTCHLLCEAFPDTPR